MCPPSAPRHTWSWPENEPWSGVSIRKEEETAVCKVIMCHLTRRACWERPHEAGSYVTIIEHVSTRWYDVMGRKNACIYTQCEQWLGSVGDIQLGVGEDIL